MPLSPQPRYRIYSRPSKYIRIFKDVLFGSYDTGNYIAELEKCISEKVGSRHAIAVPQARVGIYLVLKSMIREGQEVILSPYTIADVINMVICAGGVPVFADVEKETCNIDPAEVERLISPKTGAVMVTHLHGLMCPVEKIAEICRANNIPLLEDAAQAFSAQINERYSGTIADAGVYSFGRYKHLNGFWGGMIITPHEHIAEEIRKTVDSFSLTPSSFYLKRVIKAVLMDIATAQPIFQCGVNEIFRWAKLNDIKKINRFIETELKLDLLETMPSGYLESMAQLHAKITLGDISKVESECRTRITYAEHYDKGLRGLNFGVLPPLRTDGSHIYTCYPFQAEDREKLLLHLIRDRRDIAKQHLRNCADLPAFKDFHRGCPNARKCADQLIMLPTYPRYGMKEVERNVESIQRYLKHR